jgi:choline dehydrogenase-like flavoprotein
MRRSHRYEREIMIPRWQIFAALDLNYQWNTTSTPQEGLTLQRPMPIEQGRLLGGGSSVNVMVWGRGTQTEYNNWASFGNPGWDWEGLLPYFKKVRLACVVIRTWDCTKTCNFAVGEYDSPKSH